MYIQTREHSTRIGSSNTSSNMLHYIFIPLTSYIAWVESKSKFRLTPLQILYAEGRWSARTKLEIPAPAHPDGYYFCQLQYMITQLKLFVFIHKWQHAENNNIIIVFIGTGMVYHNYNHRRNTCLQSPNTGTLRSSIQCPCSSNITDTYFTIHGHAFRLCLHNFDLDQQDDSYINHSTITVLAT
jgi:hypothetical protein